MMADSEKLMQVTIVTPNGIVYSHRSSFVAMRAIDGDRAIMYNHTPLLTPLAIGEIRVKRSKEMKERMDHIAISGGYIEFSKNHATIIADAAERARNIDVSRAQAAKERAEQKIAKAREEHNEHSFDRAEIALQRAINRINVHNSLGD